MPQLEQEHCYLYEYCLEIPEIIDEVKDYRARQTNRAELEKKAKIWQDMNSLRPVSDAQSAAEWLSRFMDENPELTRARHTRLTDEVAFLLSCEGFPEKHWQQLRSRDRKRETQHRIIDLDLEWRKRGAKTKLSLVAPQELFDFLKLRKPKDPIEQWDLTSQDGWIERVAFKINWNRSITELKKDFHELLENQLRGSRVPFQKSKAVPSRNTSPKVALKMLAAARLLNAYEAVLKRTELLDKDGVVIELYQNPPDWIKAARKAERIQTELANRLLWSPRLKESPTTIVIPVAEIHDWPRTYPHFPYCPH